MPVQCELVSLCRDPKRYDFAGIWIAVTSSHERLVQTYRCAYVGCRNSPPQRFAQDPSFQLIAFQPFWRRLTTPMNLAIVDPAKSRVAWRALDVPARRRRASTDVGIAIRPGTAKNHRKANDDE